MYIYFLFTYVKYVCSNLYYTTFLKIALDIRLENVTEIILQLILDLSAILKHFRK